jgi:tRNA(Ser,Leu) C12 N-acetylase TAN1
MQDWNVVISLREYGFKKAFKVLQGFGAVYQTDFFNVLAMKVSDIHRFLDNLQEWIDNNPNFLSVLARVIPVTDTFVFDSAEEFEAKGKKIVLQWLPQLANKEFHVRMHRRGFKGRISSLDEEHFLGGILLDALEEAGTPGHLNFDNPDAIIVVETLEQWAGIACWSREYLERHPWMRVD